MFSCRELHMWLRSAYSATQSDLVQHCRPTGYMNLKHSISKQHRPWSDWINRRTNISVIDLIITQVLIRTTSAIFLPLPITTTHKIYTGYVKQKRAFEHAQNALIKTILHLHPGLCLLFSHTVISNDSVSRQWRPWLDCTDVWSGPLLSTCALEWQCPNDFN